MRASIVRLMLTTALFADQPPLRHGFFTREGGVSEGCFASLNCGLGSGDDVGAVTENRRRTMSCLGLPPEALVTSFQVHSARVVTVSEPRPMADRPKADAMVSRERGIALGILTADCLPVLLADSTAAVIGAAHAGWKGALAGILENVVEAMVDLGASKQSIRAGLGPAIDQASYEVGPDFPAPFIDQDSGNARYFIPSDRPAYFRFDLKGYAEGRLKAAGVGTVAAVPRDTYAEPEHFFSYRRACHKGEPDYGRLLSTICLEP